MEIIKLKFNLRRTEVTVLVANQTKTVGPVKSQSRRSKSGWPMLRTPLSKIIVIVMEELTVKKKLMSQNLEMIFHFQTRKRANKKKKASRKMKTREIVTSSEMRTMALCKQT
jgi:hypothetical protein